MRFVLTIAVLMLVQILTSNCSYLIAYKLREDSDVPLQKGSARAAIEAELGQPKVGKTTDTCQIAIYDYVPPEHWTEDEVKGAFQASAYFYFMAEPFAFIYGLLEPGDRLGVVYGPSGTVLRHVVYKEETAEEALEDLAALADQFSEDECTMSAEQAIELHIENRMKPRPPSGRMNAPPADA
jgi:hypothetical protein